MSDGPLSAYRALARSGEIGHDPAQELAAEKLNLLHHRLAHYRPLEAGGGGWLSRLGMVAKRAEPPQGISDNLQPAPCSYLRHQRIALFQHVKNFIVVAQGLQWYP